MSKDTGGIVPRSRQPKSTFFNASQAPSPTPVTTSSTPTNVAPFNRPTSPIDLQKSTTAPIAIKSTTGFLIPPKQTIATPNSTSNSYQNFSSPSPSPQSESSGSKPPSYMPPLPPMKVSEVALKQQQQTPTENCDRCDKPAKITCADCGCPYCADCSLEVHKIGKWASHRISPILGKDPVPQSSTTVLSPEQPQVQPSFQRATSPPPQTKLTIPPNPNNISASAPSTHYGYLNKTEIPPVSSPPLPRSTATTIISPKTVMAPQKFTLPPNVNAVNNTSTVSGYGIPTSVPPQHLTGVIPPPNQPSSLKTNPVIPPFKTSILASSGPMNKNVPVIDIQKEQQQVLNLKEKWMDEVIEMLMGVSSTYLTQGVFLRNMSLESKQIFYFRLTEDQSGLQYCKVLDPTSFIKNSKTTMNEASTIFLRDIQDVTSDGVDSTFVVSLKSGSRMILQAQNTIEYTYVLDGLRCLLGLSMITREMVATISAFAEVRALSQIYVPPALPPQPFNYVFATPL